MNNLLITLGHNASAIWTDGIDVIGYEEERLTRTKSDSRFPINAIHEVIKHTRLKKDVQIYVSHWFDTPDLERAKHPRIEKYWSTEAIRKLFPKCSIIAVSNATGFTHHDAHAYAATEFYRLHTPVIPEGLVHIIVSDGFGTAQEVLSIYAIHPNLDRWIPQLTTRIYGYEKSLGLFYQYATDFVGMTMNQDEYKFLGYESHIYEVLNRKQVAKLHQAAAIHATEWASLCAANFLSPINKKLDDFIQVNDVERAKKHIRSKLRNIAKAFPHDNKWELRVIIGHYIQTVVEEAYRYILRWAQIKNVIVTGGVHYNVKLNHFILNNIPGQFCAVPLAGDQGAAIGVYVATGRSFPFKSLKWGRRRLNLHTEDGQRHAMVHGLTVMVRDNHSDYVETVWRLLRKNRIVNTVTGDMEFGPRALCNTSTLALPTKENVDTINFINGRDTVMPFAPVVEASWAKGAFEDSLSRVIGSERYMITTLDYTKPVSDFTGVAHVYPDGRAWSGRPQVIYPTERSPIKDILHLVGRPLINTSLNVHGVPIVFNAFDAVNDLRFNTRKMKELRRERDIADPVLVIGNF